MRFILVDRIITLEPGQSIHAQKTLSGDEELFLDHFPGFPVVPGVLLVEMMAQASGKCLHARGVENGIAMLGKIVSATFRDWVKPDQQVDIHSEITSITERYAKAKCLVEVDGSLKASAELMFGFVQRGQLAHEYRDPVLETFLAS